MKFVVMMAEENAAERWEALTEAERDEAMAAMGAFHEAVEQRGSVVAGEALDDASTARTVHPGSGADRKVTDGPYAETVEQVGGLWIVDLPDLDTAVELVRMLPAAYTVEIRPVVDIGE
ncbi:YciI family protein [Nocardioides bigeumensis]|uniref:YciI family protein n=1 Tax=Nocardioides bigeumensis TaxID=433657 RepID=A0ABP5K5L1_9ACTN